MSAYVVFTRERTRDKEELDKYTALVSATSKGHNLTARALYGDFRVVEGPQIEGGVVLEFPSMAEAEAWYESPEYQAAAVHRHLGADFRVFIIDGVNYRF